MKERTKKKKKKSLVGWMRSHPMAMLSAVLTISAIVLLMHLPQMANGIERQHAELDRVMNEYSEMQQERNVTRTELARVNDPLYLEQLARREHSYGWYGETIYEVGNLEAIRALLEAEQEDGK